MRVWVLASLVLLYSVFSSRPGAIIRLKRFRNRFGIAAPKVVVRSHVHWLWPVSIGLLLVMLVGIAGWSLAQRDEAGVVGKERDELRGRVALQQAELEMVRALAGTAPNEASMAKATQQKLLARISDLERENALLKEDVRLYERLAPLVADQGQFRVDSFRVSPEGRGAFRYRIEALYLSGRVGESFKGGLELQIDYVVNGALRQVVLPDSKNGASDYRINIRQVLRHEGWFHLPDGAILKAIEGRLLEGGVVKARFAAEL